MSQCGRWQGETLPKSGRSGNRDVTRSVTVSRWSFDNGGTVPKMLAVGGGGLLLLAMAACSSAPIAGSPAAPPSMAATSASSTQSRPSVSVVCPPKPPAIKQASTASLGSLAPADATHGVLCVYAGLNAKVAAGTLLTVIAVPDPSGLARALNEATPVTGIYYCPMDDAGIDLVVLSRAADAPVLIEVSRRGCQFASSTLAKSSYHLSPAGFAALRQLDPTFPK